MKHQVPIHAAFAKQHAMQYFHAVLLFQMKESMKSQKRVLEKVSFVRNVPEVNCTQYNIIDIDSQSDIKKIAFAHSEHSQKL